MQGSLSPSKESGHAPVELRGVNRWESGRETPGLLAGFCSELPPWFPGVESITVYEEILRQARYRLRHGAALYARKFRLSCSEMNGRYSSNEFIVEVTQAPFLPQPPPLVRSRDGGWGGGGGLLSPLVVGGGNCSPGRGILDPGCGWRRRGSWGGGGRWGRGAWAGVKRWASEGWRRTGEKRAYPLSPPSPQVSVLHSVNRVAHPSHMLSSQQFLHRGQQPPPEMAGHSLASSHRNSST